MIMKIKCPNCDSKLNIIINIVNDEIVSIEVDTIDNETILSEEEISTILKNMGIEFG